LIVGGDPPVVLRDTGEIAPSPALERFEILEFRYSVHRGTRFASVNRAQEIGPMT